MNIRLSQDLLTGVMFIAIGLGAMAVGRGYSFGEISRIGAGFFPVVVSGLLTALGLVLVVRSFFMASDTVGAVDPRPLLLLGGTVAFGLMIENVGFPIAGAVLVVVAHFAGRTFKWVETTLLALALIAFCVLVFAYFLGLNLPHTRFW
jgi:hypothetical protein